MLFGYRVIFLKGFREGRGVSDLMKMKMKMK